MLYLARRQKHPSNLYKLRCENLYETLRLFHDGQCIKTCYLPSWAYSNHLSKCSNDILNTNMATVTSNLGSKSIHNKLQATANRRWRGKAGKVPVVMSIISHELCLCSRNWCMMVVIEGIMFIDFWLWYHPPCINLTKVDNNTLMKDTQDTWTYYQCRAI